MNNKIITYYPNINSPADTDLINYGSIINKIY